MMRYNDAPPPRTDTTRGPLRSVSARPQGAQTLGLESATLDDAATASTEGRTRGPLCGVSAGPKGTLTQDPAIPQVHQHCNLSGGKPIKTYLFL